MLEAQRLGSITVVTGSVERVGYRAAYAGSQMVRPDADLNDKLFDEVKIELGYGDMILGDDPTAVTSGSCATR